MSGGLYQWIDFAWVPLAFAAVHRGHRLMAASFAALCLGTLRLQVELMEESGYPRGFTGFLDWPALLRGQAVYSAVIALFLLLAVFSPRTRREVVLAAMLVLYVFAFCISMTVMAI